MADSRGKRASLNKAIKENVTLKKAIKEALASYNRQTRSELVVEAVDKAIDTPVQQINDKKYYDLPKRFQFLNYAVNHRPRVPQELLHLPMPENEEVFRPVNCQKHQCVCGFESRFREFKHLQRQRQHSEDLQRHIADQQISPLKVLFGFMGES